MYVWHGTLDFVLIWSVLNFLGISLEAAARALAAHPRYRALEARLSGRMVRRLHALLAAPLLVMSSLSNFYFFAGTTVSKHIITETDYCKMSCFISIVAGWPHICQENTLRIMANRDANVIGVLLLLLPNIHRG